MRVQSNKHPELTGLAFGIDDIFPTRNMQGPEPKAWPGKPSAEPFEVRAMKDWKYRPGFGRVPAYLDEQQHLRTVSPGSPAASRPASAASRRPTSAGSLRSAADEANEAFLARRGTSACSLRPTSASRSIASRPGSAAASTSMSHLTRSSSATGLALSNATVRIVEHPIAWKLHANGLNVRASHSKQPAGTRSNGARLGRAARDDQNEVCGTVGAYPATYGLHPAFSPPRRKNVSGSGFVLRKGAASTSALRAGGLDLSFASTQALLRQRGSM